MKHTRILAVAAIGIGALALAGCVSNPAQAERSSNPKVWGYVAAADRAKLEVSDTQLDAKTLTVDRVLAPQDAWIVVHLDDNGKPGARVGLQHVSRGESADVKVKLKGVTTAKVIVALHSDRATKGKFDFDMMNKEMSPDRPYFVGGKELAKVVSVRKFGVKAAEGDAAITVNDQPGLTDTLTVDTVTAPTDAWVVVHLDDKGAPGTRVGLAHIPAGTSGVVQVHIDPLPLTPKLLVAVHADRGADGVYEFDMMNKLSSPDQPFFVGGKEVATAVSVR